MANFIPLVGLEPEEIAIVRRLVCLLRHPDPLVPVLTLQALTYLETTGEQEWAATPTVGVRSEAPTWFPAPLPRS